MGNQNSQAEQKPKDDSHLYEYKKVGGIMVRVDKPQQQSFQDQSHNNAAATKHPSTQQHTQQQHSADQANRNNKAFRNLSEKQHRQLHEESEPRKPQNKLQVIQEETSSHQYQTSLAQVYTEGPGSSQRKCVRVYVDKDIEFNVEIASDQLTCGWILSEVTRRYLDELNRIRKEKEMQSIISSNIGSSSNGVIQHSPMQKYMRKMIVALKTTDQRESLDYWLTQYDRPLEVLDDGDFLIAHFAKVASNKKREICKKDFEQIKVIGRGGFSRVILVRKKDTGRLYAMKIMKKNKIIREKKLKPILSERKVLEKLSHPFIIKLHWAFQSNEELFFVMDLCTGGEIFFHLNRLKRFNEEQGRFYFAEILLGIEYLHNKNVVYRDIKPENILVDVDGHIRIADFGLSKIIPQRQKSYSFCGSPEYMSPEMLQGTGHDRKVDIYCLGALLFEMLTGLPPFYNKDTNKMYENILNQELIFPDYLNQQICNLIQGMMMKDPTRRFQSIAEVKKHPWLKDLQWDDILHKRVKPPIVPRTRDCHIDPDYIELPLDFEESQYKVRLSTERRYSYYYESTLQSKSATEQSFYNMFFEKNESGSGIVNLLGPGGQGSSVKSGVFHSSSNPYGASIQSEQSQQSQDSNQNNLGGTAGANTRQTAAAATKNIISGLENFTFIDVPKEEMEVLRNLKKYSNQFEGEKKGDGNGGSRDKSPMGKPFSMMNLNQSPAASDKNMKLFNQKHQQFGPNHSIQDPKSKFNTEEDNGKHFQNTFTYPLGDDSNRGCNFTLSNKSGLTFEESSQSIAQEFRINESIATCFGPNGQIIGSNIVAPNSQQPERVSGNPIIIPSGMHKQQPSILQNVAQNGLTIEEEDDDDDLQSVGGGKNNKNLKNDGEHREKDDNFSFKNQNYTMGGISSSDQQNQTLSNFTPSKILAGSGQEHMQIGLSTQKSTQSNANFQNQMSTACGMTTATQSSQYQTQQNYGNELLLTTSQYTSDETPLTARGGQSSSKNQIQVPPQFGRSGSQTNNIVKQISTNPILMHTNTSTSKQQQPNQSTSGMGDQTMIEKECSESESRSHIVLTPTQNKKAGNKSERKVSDIPSTIAGVQTGASQKKSSNNLKTIAESGNQGQKKKSQQRQQVKQQVSQMPLPTDDVHSQIDGGDQEVSFSRIPSISGQQWPAAVSGRESSTNQKQKNELPSNIYQDVSSSIQSQQMKKNLHKHKPSYSLSPSNLVAAQTVFQQQQQQQQQQHHINMKQALSMKKPGQQTSSSSKPQSSLNKHVPAPAAKKTIPTTSSSQGIKSFLKVAATTTIQPNTHQEPTVTNQQQQQNYKTPEDKNAINNDLSQTDQINSLLQSSTKKAPGSAIGQQSQRGQKFRSMDMTQNILKKSMGAKGAALKNNVAWKQHLLQIQTSQSPAKEQTGISQAQQTAGGGGNNPNSSQITNSYYTTITVVDQAKQSCVGQIGQQTAPSTGSNFMFQHSPMNLNSETNNVKKFIQQQQPTQPQLTHQALSTQLVAASKTPERKESDISIDQKSNATQQSTTTILYSKPVHHQPTGGVSNIADKKRRSDGSQQSISSISQIKEAGGHHQGPMGFSHIQNPSATSNKLNMFLTPKGSKVPATAVGGTATTITPTNQGYQSMRIPGASQQKTTASTSISTMKKTTGTTGTASNAIKTMGGLSRNDLNQKKSNTAQAIVSKKSKNI